MKKYVLAAVLIGAFAGSALATEGFYIVFDNTTKKCTMMTTKPTDMSRYKMMGTYSSESAAHAAMSGMKECKM